MKILSKYRRDERGSAAIEGAVLFPLLALIGFGVVDLSMLLRQTHAMEQGLVSSGGYLARAENPDQSNIQTNARNIAVYGTPSASGTERISGWTPSDVTLNIVPVANNGQYRGNDTLLVAKLSADHAYSGLGFIRLASGGKIRIRVEHEERLVRAR